jgi:hypothetical protein
VNMDLQTVMPAKAGIQRLAANTEMMELRRKCWVPAFAGTTVAHHELPINMPAINTSAPPKAIWKVAARNGVSM